MWPFSLQNDGFWEKKVSEPFAAKEKGALELLRALIGVVMMRHSKSQVCACALRWWAVLACAVQHDKRRRRSFCRVESGRVGSCRVMSGLCSIYRREEKEDSQQPDVQCHCCLSSITYPSSAPLEAEDAEL